MSALISSRHRRAASRALVFALTLSHGAHAWHGVRSDDPLTRVFYDFEVAVYCGLVSPGVRAGFERELARLRALEGADTGTEQRARMRAWKEANLEWQNRGLGGFRGWCRSEGREAAARFAGTEKP